MPSPFAILTVRLRSLSLSGVEGRAGPSLVILIPRAREKNPFHSALRLDSPKRLLFRLERKKEAKFFAEFIVSRQSEILRFAQNDSEGLSMTAKSPE